MTEHAAPVRQDTDRDPCWTFRVDNLHLQAKRRIGFPKEVAMALGCRPGGLTRVTVERPTGCRKLMVSWEQEPSARTTILQLAEPLKRIGAAHGRLVDLVVTGPRKVALKPKTDSASPEQEANGQHCGALEQDAPQPAPLSGPAPWGNPRTPLLPRWYLTTHGAAVLPTGFTNVYPRVQRVRDLGYFWEFYDGPLDKDASWALRDFATRKLPPKLLRVLDPEIEPERLDNLPLAIRTRNCLQRGRGSVLGGTVEELMRLPNFGITSLLDLMCVLEAAALHGIHPGEMLMVPNTAEETAQHASEEQDQPPQTADAARHSDAWELTVAAAREFRGASTFGDLLRLDLSDLVTAAGADAALDESPLQTRDETLAVRAVDAVQACLEDMPEMQRLVAAERVVAAQAKTLEELASVTGLSRERMRQLDHKARADLEDAAGPILGVLALVAAGRLGSITTTREIDNQVVELLPELPGSTEALAITRRLLRSRLDYRCREGLCLSRAAAEAAVTLKDAAKSLADDAGLLDADRLREVLDAEWGDEIEALVRWIGWSRVSGQIALRETVRSRVKAALLKIGSPATKSELAEESGLTETQVAGALSNIASAARADIHRWGLREWIDDVYEGIPAEILQRINEDGGSTRLNRLLDELPRLFGVNEASVWAYLNTPAFRVEHGWVSEASESDIQLRRLDDVIDGRDGNGDPYWTFEIAQRHLDGYSLQGVPPEIAAALGCHFGSRSTAGVRSPEGYQPISVIWRKTSIHGPEIGRLSPVLRALGANECADVRLTVHDPSEVSLCLTSKPSSPLPIHYPQHPASAPSSYQRLPPTMGGVTTAASLSARLTAPVEPSTKSRSVEERDET